MLGVVPILGTGTGTDIKIGTGTGTQKGTYTVMNGNEERERLDRNIGTSSSGTRSFTSTDIYIVLIQDIFYIYFIIYYNINKELYYIKTIYCMVYIVKYKLYTVFYV